MSDFIDKYLEKIARNLRGPAMESHRTLLETEDHLRLSAADIMKSGLSEDDAQKEAIARFGKARQVADGHNAEAWGFSAIGTLVALSTKAAELIAIAFVAIGLSAVIAHLVSLFTSVQAVFGLPTTAIPSIQTCSYWLSIHPTAANCQQAGTWEAAHDMTWMLGGLGIIGLVLLPAIRKWKRTRFYSIQSLPMTLSSAIGTTMFAVASVGLFAFGQSNAVIGGTWGRGMWYSESATAFVASLVSAYFLLRAIREPYRQY